MVKLSYVTLWTLFLALAVYVKDRWNDQYIEKMERRCLFGPDQGPTLPAVHTADFLSDPTDPAASRVEPSSPAASPDAVVLVDSARSNDLVGDETSHTAPRPPKKQNVDSAVDHGCLFDNTTRLFQCSRPSVAKSLTLVIPFPPKQLALVLQNIDSWITWEFFPCDPAKGIREFARLVFYLSRSDAQTFHVLKDRLVHAEHTWRACFSEISFAVSDMDEETDKYGPGTLSMFYSVFEPSFFRLPTDYVLWMEPDLVPIRRLWLDTVYFREIVMSAPFWMKGSIPRYPGGEGDRHINGNALFAVGDPRFQTFVKGSRGAFHQYDSFDQSLWTHLVNHPESASMSHLFVYSDSIQNRGYDLYDITKFRSQHPVTVLCHGKGMLTSVQNFLAPHLQDM